MVEISGWFHEDDALLIKAIDGWQKELLVSGNILELGIWEGKSLVFLASLAVKGETLLGIDWFSGPGGETRLSSLRANIKRAQLSNVRILKGDTRALVNTALSAQLRRSFRLVHIDAGHEHNDVLQDLEASSRLLGDPRSVIVLDDVPVRYFPGCWSGMAQWILSHGNEFRPFLFSSSKAYLCRKEFIPDLLLHLESLIKPEDLAYREVFDSTVIVHKGRPRKRSESYEEVFST